MTPTCTLTTWSFQRAAPHTPHSTATQHSNTAQPFTRVCLEFLTTLTFKALRGNHIVSIPFETIVKKKRPERFHLQIEQSATCSHLLLTTCNSFVFLISLIPTFFSILCINPDTMRTIQYLIPGWMTIVKLLKQVKNWQSPSRDPWSNCLINSREDDKCQSYYYSGRQKTIQRQFADPRSIRPQRMATRCEASLSDTKHTFSSRG